jgi:uncharacterized membrane protein YgcG
MMARVSFERSLEHCLQQLARMGDVEASLRRYPQYADRLRPLLEMAWAAHRHYDTVPEPLGGLAGGRERLLAVAAQQRARAVPATPATTAAQRGGLEKPLAFAVRLVVVLLVVGVGTAVVGGGIVWAASHSLPGDALYPVKVAVEDVRLALVSAPVDQVDRSLQLVEARAEEIQALVAAGQQVPDEAIARMERHVERALTRTAWASDDEMIGLLMRVAEHTRAQERRLVDLQSTAPQQAQANLARAVTVCRRGAEAAEAGLTDPQEFRWRYRHQQGTPDPTHDPDQVIVTPGGDQEEDQGQYPQRDQERESTPTGVPTATPHGPRVTPTPQATPGPQVTPQEPAPTPIPQVTPRGPSATSVPRPTPQGPPQTAPSPAATEQPQPPGDTPGGDGQDGGEHGDSGHDGGGHGGGGSGGGSN